MAGRDAYLDPHHLELEHLHGKGLVVGDGSCLREGRAEGKVVWADGIVGLLLKIKMIIAVDGGGHGSVSIVEMGVNVQKLVSFL